MRSVDHGTSGRAAEVRPGRREFPRVESRRRARRARVTAWAASLGCAGVLALAPLPAAFSSSAAAATAGVSSAGASSTPPGTGSGAVAQSGGSAALGTASAKVASVGLDLRVLGGLLGSSGLDVPLDITLDQASAPQDGTSTSSTTSLLQVRDGLLGALRIPAQDADDDLLKADTASSTVRTLPTYSQAYATAANVRLFLPFVSLPAVDASDGVLRVDSVSAVATCDAGARPTAATQLPAQLTLLGHDLQLPDDGEARISIPLLGSIDVQVGPQTSVTATSATATVAASVDIDLLGLLHISGQVTLAQASCTPPPAGTTPPGSGPTAPSAPSGGAPPPGGGSASGAGGATGVTGSTASTSHVPTAASGTGIVRSGRTGLKVPSTGRPSLPFASDGSLAPMADAHRTTSSTITGTPGGDNGSTSALTTAAAIVCAGFVAAALWLSMGRGRRTRFLPSRWLPRHARRRG